MLSTLFFNDVGSPAVAPAPDILDDIFLPSWYCTLDKIIEADKTIDESDLFQYLA